MEQCDTRPGLQTLSLFDTHTCRNDSGKDYAAPGAVHDLIMGSVELQNAGLREICSDPLLMNNLRIGKHPDGTVIIGAYNPSPGNDGQRRADMLAVVSAVSTMASIQSALVASFGTTVGGSMTFGGVHVDTVPTRGNAVDEAIVLKTARSEVYPRMAVSYKAMGLFIGLCNSHRVRTGGRLGNAIEMDADGVPFLNYLSAQFILERLGDMDGEPRLRTAMLQHRRGIERMIGWGGDSIRSDGLLRERYGWLISYHNRTVRRSGIGEEIDPSVLDRN